MMMMMTTTTVKTHECWCLSAVSRSHGRDATNAESLIERVATMASANRAPGGDGVHAAAAVVIVGPAATNSSRHRSSRAAPRHSAWRLQALRARRVLGWSRRGRRCTFRAASRRPRLGRKRATPNRGVRRS